MKIYIEKDYNALSKKAADIITDFVKKNSKCVLGLATGSTPQKTYDLLGKMYKTKKVSFKNIKTFNLDEYSGLATNNPQSYHYFMKQNFFDKTDVNIKNTFFPTDFAPNYKKYDKKIKDEGEIDLQILGIGSNGHIGFNEPNSNFFSKTRQVKLSKNTIKDNARFFKNKKDVPIKAVTMGINTIMRAKKIILLANGSNKKEAVFNALCKKVSTKTPASILQNHKDVIVILDKESAEKFTRLNNFAKSKIKI
jgi:glucosamine-6-phosphate deaminase